MIGTWGEEHIRQVVCNYAANEQHQGKRQVCAQVPPGGSRRAPGRPRPPGPSGRGGAQAGRGERLSSTSRAGRGSRRVAGALGVPPAEAVYGGQSPSCARMARRGNFLFSLCSIRLDCPGRALCWIMQDSPLGAIGWVHRLAQSIRAEPSRWIRGRRGRASRRADRWRRRRRNQRASGRSDLTAGPPVPERPRARCRTLCFHRSHIEPI